MSRTVCRNFAGRFAAWAALAFLCAPSPSLAQVEDYADWHHSRGFSLETPFLTGPVTNFPLLLRLDSTAAEVFAGARPGGADLRFRRIASRGGFGNLTDYQLSYQIAHWDSAARKAEIWVLMDSVKPTQGVDLSNFPQGLFMYWGKPDAPARSNPAAVFDTANGFLGVWHLGGSSPTAPRVNAVVGGHSAVPSGSDVATGFAARAGVIGLADTLRGGTGTSAASRADADHFHLGSGYADFSAGATLSLWIKPATPTTTAWNVFMAFGNGAPGDNLTLGRMGNTQNVFGEVYNGTSGAGRTELNDVIRSNEWQQVTFSVQGSQQTVYHNGGQNTVSRTADATIPNVTRNLAYLGRSLWPDPNVAATIDEVRLHKVRRSPDWVRLEYETQKPGSVSLQRYPAIPVAVPTAPVADAQDVPAFTTLSWEGLSLNHYHIQISTDSLFLNPLIDGLVSSPSLPLGPLSGGTYFWRVKGLELLRGTGPWSPTRKFTVAPQSDTVGTPVLVYPPFFAENLAPNIRFSWNHANGAESYHLQVGTHHEFPTMLRNDSGITALTRTVSSGLAFDGQYYWRVRGKNAFGVGPWSVVRVFKTVVSRPPAPLLLSPRDSATGVSTGATFTWATTARAMSYRVQVSLTSDFADLVKNDTTLDTSMTASLSGSRNYFWRVVAKNLTGTSGYSPVFRFTTGAPASLVPNLPDFLSVSTLRVGEETVLRLSLPRAERVTVRWRDLQGRLSAPVREERLPAGSHSLRLSGAPAGIAVLEVGIGPSRRTLLIAP
jgi:hypothetical protein